MSLSVVIPCFNEGKNIVDIAKKADKLAINYNIEIIFVNNGSTDDTSAIFSRLKFLSPNIKIIELKENKGYGSGIVQGLHYAKNKFIGWTHADLQTDLDDLITVQETILKNDNKQDLLFIKGFRQKRPFIDTFFSKCMGLFISIIFRGSYSEINAQPTIFNRALFDEWKKPPLDFSLDLYAYFEAKRMKAKILRIPVLFPPRLHGHSSWNRSFSDRLKFCIRTIKYTFNLRRNLR